MRLLWLVGILSACGSSSTHTAPLASASGAGSAVKAPPSTTCTISGVVVNASTHEPISGATVIADPEPGPVLLGDENGAFTVTLAANNTTLSFYYPDVTAKYPRPRVHCGDQQLRVLLPTASTGEVLLQ